MKQSTYKRVRYYFDYIDFCEMCGSNTNSHHVLGQRLNQSQGLNPKSKIGISTSVVKCSNCDLIYSNPQPIPFDIQDHYGIPPEDYWTPEYFTYNENYFSSEIKKAKELLHFNPGMKALDVGAGLGKGMISLERAGFDTYGFEPSVPFYERAIEKMKIDLNRLKMGMIETIDYEESFFDFITFGAVLEHLYHPAECIEKAIKWLKPSGLIHIEVPSSKHLIPKFLNTYFKVIGTNYVTHISPMHEPFHLYEFGLKSFQENAKINGYEVVFHEYYVCSIDPMPRFTHGVLSRIMKATDTGMQLAVWLKKK